MRGRAAMLACALVATLTARSARADAPSPAPPAPLTGPALGASAPAFSVKTLAGNTVSLETYRGKTLVINVWATSCAACRQETAALGAVALRLAKDGVVLLGVDATEDAPLVRAYVALKGVPYAQAVDADQSFGKAYDVDALPTTLVIDAQGVLRARFVDRIDAPQLTRLISDAKHGISSRVVSPLQAKIDAALTDPDIDFGGAPATLEANVTKVQRAIADTDAWLAQSDGSKGNGADVLQTRAEQAALRDKAIAALVSVGTSSVDKALLPRLRGDAARDRKQWKDALDAYRAALTIDAHDPAVLAGIALAARRLEQYDVAVDAERQFAELAPTDATALLALAHAQTKAGHNDDAFATYAKAEALAQQHVDGARGKPTLVQTLAVVHLDTGKAYAVAGDRRRAREEFEQVALWASKLPADLGHDRYLEESQEAAVALGLTAPHGGASVSLVPWTGPDLPGSIPNTRKFRLAVVGTPGRNVALTTAGVPKGWVASFCTDRVCSPTRVTLAIPETRVKVVEFQLVAPAHDARTPRVRVTVRDGASESTATMTAS